MTCSFVSTLFEYGLQESFKKISLPEEFAKLICDPLKARESFSSYSSREVLGQNAWPYSYHMPLSEPGMESRGMEFSLPGL